MRTRLHRFTAALLLLFVGVALVAPISPARAAADPTASALDWLSDELAANGHQLPFKGAPSFTDWGLTIDFVLALAGGGRASAGETQTTVSNITANSTSYVTDGAPASAERYAGPMAKLLYMTKVFGADSSNLGGLNIEAELRGLMVTTGNQVGRFSDHSAYGDFSNGFGQAFAVLALSRTSAGLPSEALTFLLAQQCPGGGFRLYYDSNPTCGSDAEADTDATGLTLQALAGRAGTADAISAASGWLLSQQAANGSFSGTGTTATPNANSTGIIAQGLRAVGQGAASDRAGAWIQSLQLTDANAGSASADVGAIAYDEGGRDDAISSGLPSERDPFRRATSQGALALPGVVIPPSGGGAGIGGGSDSTTISVDTAKPGDTVAVAGIGFTPGEVVQFTLLSEPVFLGTATADARGLASLTFVVPANVDPGQHTIEMVGTASGKRLSVSLQVTPSTTTTTTTLAPTTTAVGGSSGSGTDGSSATTTVNSGTLPRTGEDSSQTLPVAAALIGLGLALTAVASRRLTRHMS